MIRYRLGDIVSLKKFTSLMGDIFEYNKKDINMVASCISTLCRDYPEFRLMLEKYFKKDISEIMSSFRLSKTELHDIERGIIDLIDRANKYDDSNRFYLRKTSDAAQHKLDKSFDIIMSEADIQSRLDTLLRFIDIRNAVNDKKMYELGVWISPARHNFEHDISKVRASSINLIRNALINIDLPSNTPKD